MSLVAETGSPVTGTSVSQVFKHRTARALATVWRGIVRMQEARAKRFLDNAKKGIHVW